MTLVDVRIAAAICSGLVLAVPAAAKREPYVYGPPPDWARYKELGEAALRASLPDPDNWSIEWPNGYAQFIWFHKGRFPGYATCGRLRKVASADEPRPVVNFGIVIDYDVVKKTDISSRASNSLVNIVCAEMVARGTLPPAPSIKAPLDLPVASLGLQVRAMSEGAYVVAVEPGSAGQRAGLVPGMVITRANGIALGGLSDAMVLVLSAGVPSLALESATGDRIEVKQLP